MHACAYVSVYSMAESLGQAIVIQISIFCNYLSSAGLRGSEAYPRGYKCKAVNNAGWGANPLQGHTQRHIYGQFGNFSMFLDWGGGGAKAPRISLTWHGENVQTPYKWSHGRGLDPWFQRGKATGLTTAPPSITINDNYCHKPVFHTFHIALLRSCHSVITII